MISPKLTPKKRSGRLLVAVRKLLLKEQKFEIWLLHNHPLYYDQEKLEKIVKAIGKLDTRIQRALKREHPKKPKPVQLKID